MINITKCLLPFTCMSCKEFVQSTKIIEVQYDQGENPSRLLLCNNCQLELARRILFQRGKANATEQ